MSEPEFTEPDYTELLQILQPGRKVRVFYNENNPNNALLHVRAIVDGTHVVTCQWIGHKWLYKMNDLYFYWLLWRAGQLTDAGQSAIVPCAATGGGDG